MRSRAAAALLVAAVCALTGCTAVETDGARPAIFDRTETAADAPPGDFPTDELGEARYVGEDSAGDRYWAVWGPGRAACIVQQQVGVGGDVMQFCGGLGLSGTDARGVVMEFATAPSTLDPDTAELVGDALLVRRP